MRQWREQEHVKKLSASRYRWGLGLWAFAAKRPMLYALGARAGSRLLRCFGASRGRFASLPLAGGWTATRDFPAPEGTTFRTAWARRGRG